MECYAEVPKGRVLLVDDDPATSAEMAALLQREGFEVAFASSGYEALGAVRDTQHDLVLVDTVLPDMSGAEIARRIWASPASATLPVLELAAGYLSPRYLMSLLGRRTGRRARLSYPPVSAQHLAA